MTTLTGDTVLRVVSSLTFSARSDSATLRAGGRILRYEGAATSIMARLLPLLDGRRRLDKVIDEIGGTRLGPAVLNLCGRLVSDGMVVDVANPRSDATSDLLDRVLREPPLAGGYRRPISTLRVVGSAPEVAAIEQLSPDHWTVVEATLADLLDTPTGSQDTCTIVWLSDPNSELVAEWNESAYHNGHAWLPISHFDGEVAIVGPLVYPRETPCFECYRRRRAARSRLGEQYLDMRPVHGATLTSKALTMVLGGIAVALLHDWAARANPYLPGAVRAVTFDEGLQVATEYVLRVPRCPACRPLSNVARPILWSEDFPPGEPA